MKKVGICANFGTKSDMNGGQIIKSLIVRDSIVEEIGKENVDLVNTYAWSRHPFKLFFKCFKIAANSKNIVIMPAHNGIKVFAPLFTFLKRIFKFKLHYIVIGGWIAEKAKNEKNLLRELKKIDFIYVETKTILEQLNSIGIYNTIKLNNFKNLEILNDIENYNNECINICIFSRINEKKGISDAIETINKCNEKGNGYHLDVYGPIEEEYKKEFNELLNKNEDNVTYKGIIDYNYCTNILKKYCFLLFPTRYRTEGIPGTIIDAYASGLPVVATRWDNYKDVIIEGETGITYNIGDNEELFNILKKIKKNVNLINKMRKNCLKKAEEYTPKNNISSILERLAD